MWGTLYLQLPAHCIDDKSAYWDFLSSVPNQESEMKYRDLPSVEVWKSQSQGHLVVKQQRVITIHSNYLLLTDLSLVQRSFHGKHHPRRLLDVALEKVRESSKRRAVSDAVIAPP